MTYETVGEFVDLFAAVGWEQSEVVTAATPWSSARTRTTRPMTTSWCVAPSHGRRSAGLSRSGHQRSGHHGENHHVCPIHPEYAELPPITIDKEAAFALLEEAGQPTFVFEISSIDDDYRRNTPTPSQPSCATRASRGTGGDPGLDLLERLDDLSVQLHQLEPPRAWRADPQPRLSARAFLGTKAASPTPSSTRFSTRPTASRTPMPAARSCAAAEIMQEEGVTLAALLAVALPALQAPAW
jgi:hypothetical protein